MNQTLYNPKGEPIAYICNHFRDTIYLWDGHPVAYLYSYHIYGFNGKHLGWFIDGIIYDYYGDRAGFTSTTCPVSAFQDPPKAKKYPREKTLPRCEAPSLPDLGFNLSSMDFEEFLKTGQISPPQVNEELQEEDEED